MRPAEHADFLRKQWGDFRPVATTDARSQKEGLGCAMVVVLPTVAIGGYVIGNAILNLVAGRLERAKDGGITGLLCLLAGFGLTFLLKRRYREETAFWAEREKTRDAPWLRRADWAAGLIQDDSSARLGRSIAKAVLAFAVLGPMASGVMEGQRAGLNLGTVLTVLISAAGIGLLINGVMGLLRYARFGTSRLKLATIPGVVGLALRGEVFTNRRLDTSNGLLLRLRCIRHVRDMRPSGSKTRVITETFWEEERRVTPDAASSGSGVRVPFEFPIPRDVPSLDDNDSLTWYDWQLQVVGDVPGVDYLTAFDVPIYRTKESKAPAVAALPAEDAAPGQDTRPHDSSIRVSFIDDQVEIEFPPGRHQLITLRMAAWAAGMAAITAYLLDKGAGPPVIFPALFGAVALIRALDLWLRASRVRAGRGSIEVAVSWIVPGAGQTFPSDRINDLSLKNGDQILGRLTYDIVLEIVDGPTYKVGRNIENKREAEWLIARLVRALEAK